MSIAPWIAQILLAVFYGMAGVMKTFQIAKVIVTGRWTLFAS